MVNYNKIIVDTYNCVGTAPGSMLFPIEYSLGMHLSLAHLLHSSTPLSWVETDRVGKFSKHVSHFEDLVDAIASLNFSNLLYEDRYSCSLSLLIKVLLVASPA